MTDRWAIAYTRYSIYAVPHKKPKAPSFQIGFEVKFDMVILQVNMHQLTESEFDITYYS